MSSSISFSAGGPAFSLSNERVARMMSGDRQTATHMGLWDKFKDVFRAEKKQDALNTLFKLVDSQSPARSFDIFNRLAQLATPSNRTLFTVAVAPEQGGGKISYCINGQPLKTERLSPEGREVILARLGAPLGAEQAQAQAASLADYRMDVSPGLMYLLDGDFASGGVHKRFHADTGVLQARDEVGRADFVREGQLEAYAESRPALRDYLSTQQQIAAPPGVSDKFAYARVEQYDPAVIVSRELDVGLPLLSLDQARSVAAQLVDMARTFYCHQLSHRDLHMQNLLVHERKEDGAVFLKAIDFGRAKFGEAFEAERFNDIDYLFKREGCSLAETVGRNYLAGKDSAVARKHYPLHKLLERFNERGAEVTETLSGIGKMLKADLQMAGPGDELRIDQAFERASASVQMALAGLARPQLGVGLRL
ncbi:hypothetical protein JW897_22825 [Chromobacterium alkanivorans]|uniref:hypothetical protein n=1 Tax=Chromobacterium TaxID=535 RepID=UPI000653C168|nr:MULTISPECIES: hypothetical protein [Chromobacterium]KMN83401.1 hypothetical protein VK98_03060 [Chromobacterium sp. LK11]MBN3006581.1 hypothetical protein [Chromobacterium alkanivorans]